MLACNHINKGGTDRGPCLETECASGVRRVRFRRRDFAGCILSSSGRRRRQTNKPKGEAIRHRRAEALSGVLLSLLIILKHEHANLSVGGVVYCPAAMN